MVFDTWKTSTSTTNGTEFKPSTTVLNMEIVVTENVSNRKGSFVFAEYVLFVGLSFVHEKFVP